MVVADAGGIIVLTNREADRVFGYEEGELVGQPIDSLVPERHRAMHPNQREQFLQRQRVRRMSDTVTLSGRRKDGSEFPAAISLSPLESEGQLFVASAIRDLTDRVAQERALQIQKKFSGQLIATLQAIVLLLDPDARIVLVNPFFETLSGYRADEIVGQDWIDTFIPPDERSTIRDYFVVVMKEGMNQGHANAIVLKDGRERIIQWHSKTLETEPGEIGGLLCTGFDITEQTETTNALAKARRDAESANASKSRFLAAASHDLRQPLQSIGLYLSVMNRRIEQSGNAGDLAEVSAKIRQSLDTMGELLDALLDFSRFETGSITPEEQDFGIRELIERVVVDNVQQAEKKGLTLSADCDDAFVRSDPALLERIVENFVTNAIRYTAHGSVHIACQTEGASAHIAVRDTGQGIPQSELDKIFDEYYQLDNPARERSKGLGLGLAIVQHIAELLNHKLDVHSEPGIGSTFSVLVPLGAEREEPAADTQPAEISIPQQGAQVVLFVDDDPAIVDATCMLLRASGFRVYSATNGDEALEHIGSGVQPDILVSDYRLPGYTGVELIRRARRIAPLENLPSIVLTGDTSLKQIESEQLENCSIMHKPVDSDRLLSLITNATAASE